MDNRQYLDSQGVEIKAGYVTFTGRRLSQAEADQYNRLTDQVNYTFQSDRAKQWWLDQRHKFFTCCAYGTFDPRPEVGYHDMITGLTDGCGLTMNEAIAVMKGIAPEAAIQMGGIEPTKHAAVDYLTRRA